MAKPRVNIIDQSLEGIVLRLVPYGDTDLILSVLCPGQGKRSFLARQARKSQKKFGSAFDLFDCGKFEIGKGKGPLPVMRSYIPVRSHRKLRENLDKLTIASLLTECFDVMLPDGAETDDEYYSLLEAALLDINNATEARDVLRFGCAALVKLIEIAGYLDAEKEVKLSPGTFRRAIEAIEEITDHALQSKNMAFELIERTRLIHQLPAQAA